MAQIWPATSLLEEFMYSHPHLAVICLSNYNKDHMTHKA